MRKRTLGVVLVTGLAMSGASAFTGSNTFSGTQGTKVAGYGQATATGMVVTDLNYILTADKSKLDSVTFTTSTNVTGADVTMLLKNGANVVGSPYTCTSALGYVAATSSAEYECALATDVALADFDGVGLSAVTPN